VGAGRHARGEVLSGHRLVKINALIHLLPLLVKYADADHPDVLDDIDPFRRFSQAFPTLGAELHALLLLETPQCATGLLALAGRVLGERLPDYPAPAVAVVGRHIAQVV
ncbi:MAG: hypothetical protein JW910_23280, partial [Anaerolineae bacterium]|nr:hypothetical protein [Anaerolineae bacterium]